MHILYVTKPIDKDFQSLDVSVPVKIDDVTIDAKNAPVFFSVGIDGYLSVRNGDTAALRAGAPGGAGTLSSRADLALAAGFVVVSPGCRRGL